MLRRLTPLDGDTILPLADAKAHLRVRHSEEDALIASLRDAAIVHVERAAGVSLAVSTFTWTAARFAGGIELPVRPVVSVASTSYLDSAGEAQPYASARLVNGAVYPAAGGSWPSSYGSVTVTFTAGYDDAAKAPDLLAAVKVKLQALYDRDQGSGSGDHFERAIDSLVAPYRDILA